MDTSKQNSDTTKTVVKNLWKDCDGEYQLHATIFSTDSTTESDETTTIFKKVNIMDLEKRKELYGVCGECNEPGKIGHWDIENQEWIRTSIKVALKSLNNSSNNISNDFLNEIKYYISGHFHFSNTVMCFGITQDPNTKDYMMVLQYYGLLEPVNSTDYSSSFQEAIPSSSANPISECLDCELNELDLN
ncbi:unnamed protein product [Rhizophagus irregularis]|nr:unnamed protein product [Rhizophagus irregularis]